MDPARLWGFRSNKRSSIGRREVANLAPADELELNFDFADARSLKYMLRYDPTRFFVAVIDEMLALCCCCGRITVNVSIRWVIAQYALCRQMYLQFFRAGGFHCVVMRFVLSRIFSFMIHRRN